MGKALFSVLCSFPLFVFANDTGPDIHIGTIEDAKPLERKEPKYPTVAAKKRQEGWVRLSFIVEADGSVSEPIIEDSSGQRAFEKSAIRAIKQWKYEPAMQDGEPIQQCETMVQLDYRLANVEPGARRKYVVKVKELSQALEQNNMEEADELMEKLSAFDRWNLYEDAWYWYTKAEYHRARQQPLKQMQSLSRIVRTGTTYLPAPNYLMVLQDLFILHVKFNQLQNALEDFEHIKMHDKVGEVVAHLQPYATKVTDFLNSDNLLTVAGEIEEEFWKHRLNRHSFTITGTSGEFDHMDIRCKNKRNLYQVSKDMTWHIPSSWGSCNLYIYGAPGSQLTIAELPYSQTSHVIGGP